MSTWSLRCLQRENTDSPQIFPNPFFPPCWVPFFKWKFIAVWRTGLWLKIPPVPTSQGLLCSFFPDCLAHSYDTLQTLLYRIIWWVNERVKDGNQRVAPNYEKNDYNHPCCNTRLLAKRSISLKSIKRGPSILNKNLSSVCNHKY